MSIFAGRRPILSTFQISNMNEIRPTVQATARGTSIHTHTQTLKNYFFERSTFRKQAYCAISVCSISTNSIQLT
jgi:hypothetical protein